MQKLSIKRHAKLRRWLNIIIAKRYNVGNRIDNNSNNPHVCGGCGCVMVDEEVSWMLAPAEDDLEEGEVRIEDESEEESTEWKHATGTSPQTRDR